MMMEPASGARQLLLACAACRYQRYRADRK